MAAMLWPVVCWRKKCKQRLWRGAWSLSRHLSMLSEQCQIEEHLRCRSLCWLWHVTLNKWKMRELGPGKPRMWFHLRIRWHLAVVTENTEYLENGLGTLCFRNCCNKREKLLHLTGRVVFSKKLMLIFYGFICYMIKHSEKKYWYVT